MQKILITPFLLCVVLFAQAQKIPFQGKLTQNDEPFSGSVTLEFSIASAGWTETHPDVGVLDGFYSVVLGSITPLPDSLFDNSDEVSMGINVDGTDLSPVTLYAPYGAKTGRFVIKESTDTTTTALQVINNSTGTSFGTGSRTGAYVEAKGEGLNTGLFAYAENGRSINNQTELTDPQAYTTGQLSSLYGNSEVGGRALQAQYTATGPGHGVGLSGYAGGGGTNWAVWGRANSGGTPSDSAHVGAFVEAYGSGTGEHYGVKGIAYGENASRNVGVYGMAYNGINENYAGWFDGDVNVNGTLMVNGEPFGGSNFSTDSIKTKDIVLEDQSGNMKANLRVNGNGNGNLLLFDSNNLNGAWLGHNGGGGIMQIVGYDTAGVNTGAMLGYHPGGLPSLILESNNNGDGPFSPLVHLNTYDDGLGSHKGEININSSERVRQGVSNGITMSISPQEQPFIELKGGNDLNWDVRGQFRVDSVGTIGTAGRLELLGPLGNVSGDVNSLFSVQAANDPGGIDPTGTSAEMFLWGTETLNFQIGGKPWEENDHPTFQMFGSKTDGGGWYRANVNLDVYSDGTYDAGVLALHKTTEGAGYETVVLQSNGMNKGGQLILRDSVANDRVVLFDDFGTGKLDLIGTAGHLGLNAYSISAGFDAYTDGYVINMDTTNGPLMEMYSGGANTINIQGNSGNITATGTVAGNILQSSDGTVQTSDRRLKENIQTLDNALDNTNKLRGVSYNWIDKNKSQKRQIGVIAQEVEEVFPEFVLTDDKGMKAVNYAQMVGVLIEAIKELNQKVTDLRAENADLKASLEAKHNDEVAALQKQIDAIKALIGTSAQGAGK